MEMNAAVNIAVGCVLASHLATQEKNEIVTALRNLETEASELKRWCQTAKDVLEEKEFNFVQEAYEFEE